MSTIGNAPDDKRIDEIGREQKHVSTLYARLDSLAEQASVRLARTLRETGGTQQARSERDSLVTQYTDQLAAFGAVENGLCFGRLDIENNDRRYIGRLGIFDEDGDYQPLLVDWRAPAARPFYLATAASPQGVRRRRHIRTEQRAVVGLDDEVLDLSEAGTDHSGGLGAEAALLAALTANRTGRMRDIVETIQAEQDHIIRADLNGALVVQGGPGTGKTAVALHRAAYLLYTYRQQLSTRGVLIVGPNETFLRYISQVLPSLAETGVLLRTPGQLYPGVTATATESPRTAEIKGRAVMAEVVAAAVADRERLPEVALEITFEQRTLRLDRQTCARARSRARGSRKLHNLARAVFVDELIDALAALVAEQVGVDPYANDPLGGDDAPGPGANLFSAADLADIRDDLRADPEVRAALDWLWPTLTPQRLLADLFADPDAIASAAGQLTEAEQRLLRRAPDHGWTPADAPLLDEAAHLLGVDDDAERRAAEQRRQQELAYAQGALEVAIGSRSIDVEDEDDPEILAATDLLDASRLAERQAAERRRGVAELAAADREWAFGHVIVDEAQELSPMAWRLLMRRCPSRSMTIVGDVAQTSDLAGALSWPQMLAPYLAQRWRLAELTISYRTPAEIMALAAGVLAEIDPTMRAPRPVRSTGVEPAQWSVPAAVVGEHLLTQVRHEIGEVAGGRIGVIVPNGRVGELRRVVADALGHPATLDDQVAVLTVAEVKGLEFDSVLVVDPDGIVAESPRGRNDLYVALTRATRRLGVSRVSP